MLWLAPIVMIVAAIFGQHLGLPYGYYTLMRFVISGTCILAALNEHEKQGHKSQFWFIASIAMAVLYNPFISLHLGRELWTIINIPTIGLYVAHFLYFKKTSKASALSKHAMY